MSVREGASYITARENDPWDAAYSTGATIKLAQTAAQNSKLEGLVYFITHWPQRLDDTIAHQVWTAGAHHTGVCAFERLLEESQRTGEVASWMQPNPLKGAGFHFGVYTLKRTPYLRKSIELFRPAPFLHLPSVQGHTVGPLTQEDEARYAPYGFSMTCWTDGGTLTFHRVSYTYEEIDGVWSWVRHEEHTMSLGEPFIAHTSSLAGQKAPPFPLWGPYNYHVNVYVAKRYGDDKTEEELRGVRWTLYHTKKVNVEITPAHLTKYDDGVYVNIVVTPIGNRVITEFTVQGVDHLVDGTEINEATQIFYPDPENRPDGYKPGQARYLYGPIHSDIYVTAVAEGVEVEEPVKAGIPYTIQLTTDDCLVEAGSWELGDTNLPSSVTYSISELGLVDIYIPQDVYDGNPGGVYYLNVTFNGYSQTKGLTLLITVEDSPAYGTVWEVLYDFPAPVRGIFQASNGTWYISTTNQIYKSTDLETFDACTMTGSVNKALSQVVEIAGGKLVVSDKNAIWITDGVTDTFVRQDTWTILSDNVVESAKVGGDPTSPIIWHTCTRLMGDTLVWARNSTTGAMTHELRVDMGVHGLSPVPPKLLPTGNWLISLPGVNKGYKVYLFNGSSFTLVATGAQTTASLNPFTIDSTGRITLVGVNSLGVFFSRYSDDNGVTWSDEVNISASAPAAIICLKEGYFLTGQSSNVMRTADGFANLVSITPALDGNITCFALNEYDKTILAGTLGTTHNLYISRS